MSETRSSWVFLLWSLIQGVCRSEEISRRDTLDPSGWLDRLGLENWVGNLIQTRAGGKHAMPLLGMPTAGSLGRWAAAYSRSSSGDGLSLRYLAPQCYMRGQNVRVAEAVKVRR